jgi:predicted MFS family arabinose efflux permease
MALDPSTSPRGRSRWPVVAAFASLAAASQLVWLNYAPATTAAAAHFGVSETAIGWLATVLPLWYVLLAIPAGMVLDRWFKAGIAIGALLTAAGAVLRHVDDTYGWALTGQMVIAIGQPLVLNAIPGVARHYLAAKDRASGIAISSAGTFAGMVAAFVLGAVLPDSGQLTTFVGIGTGISCATAVAMLVALRQPMHKQAPRPVGQRVTVSATFSDPFIRRICVIAFFQFGIFNAISTFAQPLLEPAGVQSSVASVILLLTVLAGVVACVVVPPLAVRHHRERQILVAGLAVSSVGCLLLAVAPSVFAGFLSLTVIGFVLIPALPIILELLERRTGDAEGTAAGLVWCTGNIGGLLVPALVGLFVDTPLTAFLICAGVALLGIPSLYNLRAPAVPVKP